MDLELTSDSAVTIAVQRLREAGYVDASAGNRREGDPLHILSVSTGDKLSIENVMRIVREVDSAAHELN